MQGKCRIKNVLYKCIASAPTKPRRAYIDISEDECKKQHYTLREKGPNTDQKKLCTWALFTQ